MSRTEIYAFNAEGTGHLVGEIRNAWRGAMAIWRILDERYLPPYIPDYFKYCNWYKPEMPYDEVIRLNGYKPSRCSPTLSADNPARAIWDLVNNPDIPESDRIVLFTTFDRCLVKCEDIPRVIEAFRQFVGETSLSEQADLLEIIMQDTGCIAIGWNQTSVSGDTWNNIGGEDEDGEKLPYNCLTGDYHYWLFDELDKFGDDSMED